MAKMPEQTDYTPTQERIEHPGSGCLRPFDKLEDGGIPFKLKDYLELVDWAFAKSVGRCFVKEHAFGAKLCPEFV